MAGDPNLVLRSTGTIYMQVQNLTTAPYGGFEAGFFENGVLTVDEDNEDVISESLGKRLGKLCGETTIGFEFDLVQNNLPALQFLWSYSAPTTIRESGLSDLHPPGGFQGNFYPLLMQSADPTHPSLLLFNAVFIHMRKRIPWGSMEEKRRERIRVEACSAANGRVYMYDTIDKLSLS